MKLSIALKSKIINIRFVRYCTFSLLLIICTLLLACANKPLVAKTGVKIDTLYLCMNFDEQTEASEKLLYLDAVKDFIDQYNDKQKKLRLAACIKKQQQSLIVTVNKTRWIEPKKQVFYVLISTVGIAYPLTGGSFGFAWLAMNGSNLQLAYSPDLAETNKPVYRYFSSWPYFNRMEALQGKHMEKFQEFMFETLENIEKDLTLASN